MESITTIQIDRSLKNKLDKLKVYPRETYNEIILRLLQGTSPSCVDRESLIETIEVLSDPETMREIAESLEEYEKCGGTSLKQIKKELNL